MNSIVGQLVKHGSEQLKKNTCGSVSKLTKLHLRTLDGWFFVHIVLFLWDLHSSEFKQQLSCSKLWRLVVKSNKSCVSAPLNQIKKYIYYSASIKRESDRRTFWNFNARKRTKALKAPKFNTNPGAQIHLKLCKGVTITYTYRIFLTCLRFCQTFLIASYYFEVKLL